jgi:hypothetical protein
MWTPLRGVVALELTLGISLAGSGYRLVKRELIGTRQMMPGRTDCPCG